MTHIPLSHQRAYVYKFDRRELEHLVDGQIPDQGLQTRIVVDRMIAQLFGAHLIGTFDFRNYWHQPSYTREQIQEVLDKNKIGISADQLISDFLLVRKHPREDDIYLFVSTKDPDIFKFTYFKGDNDAGEP
ncbi:hypothetical protein ACFL2V_16300 [Pseudomonadota bacterium]